MKNRVSIFLMGEKGLKTLKAIVQENYSFILDKIIIGKDFNVQKDYSSEIESVCKSFNLNYFFRGEDFEINSEYIIAISWRWMISTNQSKLIVLHDSLLPSYRGFAPVVNQLINKEKYLGVSAIFASEKYDEGDIISSKQIKIDYPIKISNAIGLVGSLYAKIVIEILSSINNNLTLISVKQNNDYATYSLWRDEQDYFINWNRSATHIKRFVDAVGFPYKGAKSYLNNKEVVIIDEVEVVNDLLIIDRDSHIGKVVFMQNDLPVIVCGEGLLKIIKLKFENNDNDVLPLNKFRSRFK